MISLIALILLVPVLFFFEAKAHSYIIKGLTRCGQPQKENDAWHNFFLWMWITISVMILLIDLNLWLFIIYLGASRLLIFPILLNTFLGNFDPMYLSDNGIDFYMKKYLGGEKGAFIVRGIIWILSIFLLIFTS